MPDTFPYADPDEIWEHINIAERLLIESRQAHESAEEIEGNPDLFIEEVKQAAARKLRQDSYVVATRAAAHSAHASSIITMQQAMEDSRDRIERRGDA